MSNTHLSDHEAFGITDKASRNSRQSALETTLSERSPEDLPGSTGIPVPNNSVSASLTNSSTVLQSFPVETDDFSMVFTDVASPVSSQPAEAAGVAVNSYYEQQPQLGECWQTTLGQVSSVVSGFLHLSLQFLVTKLHRSSTNYWSTMYPVAPETTISLRVH